MPQIARKNSPVSALWTYLDGADFCLTIAPQNTEPRLPILIGFETQQRLGLVTDLRHGHVQIGDETAPLCHALPASDLEGELELQLTKCQVPITEGL